MTGRMALVGGRLIDGRGGDPVEDAVVVVDGGRITAVGRASAVSLPADARRVDVGGLTLLPGLIDTHVHLLTETRPLQDEHNERPSQRLYRAIPFARRTLEAGVTTVRDAGMTPAGMKLAIEEGIFPGPRMQVAVNVISQTGGHGDTTMPSGLDSDFVLPDLPKPIADGPDEMRKVVRTMIRAGADWIKLCTTGGVLSPLDPPDTPQFTVEEIGVAVAEARAARLHGVMAHAIGAEGIKHALRAGVRSIEHGDLLDEEAIDLLLVRGAYLVPTMHALVSIRERAAASPGSMPPWAMAKLDRVAAGQRETLGEAIRRGVPVAMGTDSGVGFHGTNARELGFLVSAGMTPMAAIEAATRVAADLLDLADDLGTVEAGKVADLVAVAADPIASPEAIGDPAAVRLVAKAGAIVKDLDGRFAA